MKKIYKQSIKKLEKKLKIKETLSQSHPQVDSAMCEWHNDCLWCKNSDGGWDLIRCLE